MTRPEMISRIKSIVEEWGGFTISEVDGAESPLFEKEGKDAEWMVEGVNTDDLKVTKYIHGIEVDENYVSLDDSLPKRVLSDILSIVEDYETEQEKTWKRCQN